jgi:fructokinase
MKDREQTISGGRGPDLQGRPLVVGEVLFDVMPDGNRVLGGAPFNVAWHLQAFGLRPLLITRVGADDAGGEVLAAMDSWGLDRAGVQRDEARPTGQVQVDLDDGQPTFHILPDQAYDFLDRGLAMEAIGNQKLSLIYHGSLISRGELSANVVDECVRRLELPVFIDVNLRDPWWTRERVTAAVDRARWAKLNEDELALLAGASDVAAVTAFREELDLAALIVTRGSRGAAVADDGGMTEAPPPGEVKVVDTVGAGDAFSSVFLLGLVSGWPTRTSLERALEFAAAVCTQPGATSADQSLYSGFGRRGWW